MKTYAAAVLTMVLLSFGQVLLKLLTTKASAAGISMDNWRRDASGFLGLGAGICLTYMAVLFFWLYVLKSLELNRAFAFASLTFIFVPLFSYFILRETITLGAVAGSMLIITGILLSANY